MIIPVLSWYRGLRAARSRSARVQAQFELLVFPKHGHRHARAQQRLERATLNQLSDELGRPRLSVVRGGQG